MHLKKSSFQIVLWNIKSISITRWRHVIYCNNVQKQIVFNVIKKKRNV